MKDEDKLNKEENIPKDISTDPLEIKKQISKSIMFSELFQSFLEKSYNEKFEAMSSDLINFLNYLENEENTNNEKSDEMTYKNNLYNLLEKNLIEIIYLSRTEYRENRINDLYNWYKRKIQLFKDIKYINKKSYDDLDAIGDEAYFGDKNKKVDEIIYEDDKRKEEMKHRTQGPFDKKMLNNYQRINICESPYFKQFTNKSKLFKLKQKKEQKEEQGPLIDSSNINHFSRKSPSFILRRALRDSSSYYSTLRGKKLFGVKKIDDKLSIANAEGGEKERTFHKILSLGKDDVSPEINKEVKSSYSFNRPFYDFYLLSAERKIAEKKFKLVALKRNEEEKRKYIEKIGMDRARYKESVLQKNELKNVINMYIKRNKIESSLLSKYYQQANNNLITKKGIIEPSSSETIMRESQYNYEDDSNKVITGKYSKNDLIPLKKSVSVLDNPKKITMYKRTRSSMEMEVSKCFRRMGKKVILDEIQNINKETNQIMDASDENIKTYNIKLKYKYQADLIKQKLLKSKINSEYDNTKTSSDVVYKLLSEESIFKQKMLSENLCSLSDKFQDTSEEDTMKDESIYHNFCLSAFTFKNIKTLNKFKNSLKNDIKILKYISPDKTIGNKKLINENTSFSDYKDNFLCLRKTIGEWKKFECEKLLSKINKDNNSKIRDLLLNKNNKYKKHKILINAIINPIEENAFPLVFLPRSERSLLSKSESNNIIEKKKRRRRK